MTLSTAEAELTEIIEGMVAGESIHVILQELFPDAPKVLKTDNMPALSILTGDGGSWRTRHLRLRAAYARQSVFAGEWALQHVPGEFMVADIGTKPLTAARFESLKLESKSEVEVEEGKVRKEGEEERTGRRAGQQRKEAPGRNSSGPTADHLGCVNCSRQSGGRERSGRSIFF